MDVIGFFGSFWFDFWCFFNLWCYSSILLCSSGVVGYEVLRVSDNVGECFCYFFINEFNCIFFLSGWKCIGS